MPLWEEPSSPWEYFPPRFLQDWCLTLGKTHWLHVDKHHLLKNLFTPTEFSWHSGWKKLPINVWALFPWSPWIPLVHMLILNLSYTVLINYCSFVVSFKMAGTSLVVQCLRLSIPSAGGPSEILARGPRSLILHLKIPQAAAWHSQIKEMKNKLWLFI